MDTQDSGRNVIVERGCYNDIIGVFKGYGTVEVYGADNAVKGVKTVCIIEESESGKLLKLDPEGIKFTS